MFGHFGCLHFYQNSKGGDPLHVFRNYEKIENQPPVWKILNPPLIWGDNWKFHVTNWIENQGTNRQITFNRHQTYNRNTLKFVNKLTKYLCNINQDLFVIFSHQHSKNEQIFSQTAIAFFHQLLNWNQWIHLEHSNLSTNWQNIFYKRQPDLEYSLSLSIGQRIDT